MDIPHFGFWVLRGWPILTGCSLKIDWFCEPLAKPPAPLRLRACVAGRFARGSEVVKNAHEACPSDPEIWLAYLVVKADEEDGEEWFLKEVEEAIGENRFSAGTLTRAGDFMRRQGMLKAAMKCAKYAVMNARGLLPAYVLGLRCGLHAKNVRWSMLCARQAASSAVDPWPFIKVVGEIESGGMSLHIDAEDVLEKLRKNFPEEPKWALRLINIYLIKGQATSAMNVIESVIANRPENIDLRMLLLAAEAARRTGQVRKSIKILERVHAMHPSNRVVLNNLIYSLAFERETIPRAKELLPKLFELWGDSFVAFDTAAVVYRNADETNKAKEYLRRAMDAVRDIDPVWLERNPTAVDIDAYMGDYDYSLDKALSDNQRAWFDMSRNDLYRLGVDLMRKAKETAQEQ